MISPLLSNIYLHNVMDLWFETMVRPCMKGGVFLVRFADDLVIGFSDKQDALRVMDVLPRRFSKFGLTVHPEKTRLVCFERPWKDSPKPHADVGTFDFLGFTHYWAKSRKGNWVVKQKTASKRLRAKIKEITEWCKKNMHLPIREQHKALCSKLRGHYQYYGISSNYRSLSSYRHAVVRAWFKWLNRRSRKGQKSWESFNDFLKHLPLPQPKTRHSYV